MSGNGSAQLPDDAWADPHMIRAWHTRDFRAVFHVTCRHGLKPEGIASVTGLHVDQVLSVMRGNETLDSAEQVESVARGLKMPNEARKSAGVPQSGAIPAVTVPVTLAPKPQRPRRDDHPGMRIAELRHELGWSREYLAERADVSVPTISKIERQERTPSLDMMRKISRALGVAVADIVDLLSLEKSGRKRERLPDYLPDELLGRPYFIAACRARNLGRIFTAAVESGFTASHLARRCEMTATQVTAYMRHGRQASDVAIFDRVSDGLHIPGNLLGIAPRTWEADSINESNGVNQDLSSDRLGVIHGTIEDGQLSPSSAFPNQQIELLRQEMNDIFRDALSNASLDEWEHIAIRYAKATRDRAPGILLGDISQDLAELVRLVRGQRNSSAIRRLTRVSAQMSGLMCLAFCLLDDRQSFRKWSRTASLAGHESGDPETLSWVLAQEAYGHYYSGDITEAVDVARHAYEVVRAPCVGSALASALEARAYAITGRDTETRNALARAEGILSQLDGDALIPSAFGYNEASFRFHEGNAYTHLRDVKSAMRAQDRALELCAPDNYTDWAMTRLDRAQCLIYAGEIASALEYACATITELVPAQRRGIIALRGQEIMNKLPEDEKKRSAARDFRDLLTAVSAE